MLTRSTSTCVAASLAGMLLAGSVALTPAAASFPGENGKILFVRSRAENHIFVMNSSGSGVTRLTSGPEDYTDPAWSPDGTQIVFVRSDGFDTDIWLMDADGSNQHELIGTAFAETAPTWSPDGTQIAYEAEGSSGQEIRTTFSAGGPSEFVINGTSPSWSPDGSLIAFAVAETGGIRAVAPDGTGVKQITSGADIDPDWAPDGEEILFVRQFSVHKASSTGENVVEVTEPGFGEAEADPTWSPDGTSILFTRFVAQEGSPAPRADIFSADVSGSNPINLTAFPTDDTAASWQPCSGSCPGGELTKDQSFLSMATAGFDGNRLRVEGELEPPRPGATVKVKLSRRAGGRFEKVAVKTAVLQEAQDIDGDLVFTSPFQASFRRKNAGKSCKIVATFAGDEELSPSKAVIAFTC